MVHNLIQDVYPHPEKFWITLDTQYKLGGVGFLTTNNSTANSFISIDFDNIDRNPYETEDPALRFEIKLIRYIVDSNINKYISLDKIKNLVLCRVYDIDAFSFPQSEEYAIYLPTTNTLAIGSDLPLDKKTFETNPIFLVLLLQ